MSKTPGDGRSVVSAVWRGSFYDRIVVDCPACGGKALITLTAQAANGRRLVCHDCHLTRDLLEPPRDRLVDPFMGLRPRLRAETRHGDLVARNEDHLDYLEQYLSGRLRVEIVQDGGLRNASVVSRLPVWAKSAKNRDEILKAIAKVRREKL